MKWLVAVLTLLFLCAPVVAQEKADPTETPTDTIYVKKDAALRYIQARIQERNQRITDFENAVKNLEDGNKDDIGVARGWSAILSDSIAIQRGTWDQIRRKLFPQPTR